MGITSIMGLCIGWDSVWWWWWWELFLLLLISSHHDEYASIHSQRICRANFQVWNMDVWLRWRIVARRQTHRWSCRGFAIASRAKSVDRASMDCFDQFHVEKNVLFVTNNATKSRRSYKTKFDQLGVEAHVVRALSFHIADASAKSLSWLWHIHGFLGWDLWICVCDCCLYLNCVEFAERQESICYRNGRIGRRAAWWRSCIHWWHRKLPSTSE